MNDYVRDEVKFRQMSEKYLISKKTAWNRVNKIEFTKNYCDDLDV